MKINYWPLTISAYVGFLSILCVIVLLSRVIILGSLEKDTVEALALLLVPVVSFRSVNSVESTVFSTSFSSRAEQKQKTCQKIFYIRGHVLISPVS